MAEPNHQSSTIPVAPIIQRQRAEIRVEMDIAGASMTAISDVDGLIDLIIAEALVITAAELLRSDAPSVAQSLAQAQKRMLPNSYRTPEELVSRVSGDVATRSAAEAGYVRLRDLLADRPRAHTPPPIPPKPIVLPLKTPAIQAAFPSARRQPRREVKTFILGIVSVLLLLLLTAMTLHSFTHQPQSELTDPASTQFHKGKP